MLNIVKNIVSLIMLAQVQLISRGKCILIYR